MTIPLQFASLYGCQEVFKWSDRLLDLGTDFLVGNMVFVRCVVSCGSTSFPWFVFFFRALLQEGEREADRQTYSHTHTDRDRERQRQRKREKERET